MRFYTQQHKYYCGIDLHARTMYLCVLDQGGEILLHHSIPCDPDVFVRTIAPYRDDLVVAVECMARARHCRSWPTSLDGPSTSCLQEEPCSI